MAGGTAQRFQSLEERHDVQPADAVGRPEQPGLAGQQQHLQQVGRLGGAADDVGLDRLGALLLQHGRDGAERLHHLARLRRERQVGGDQRPRLLKLARPGSRSARWATASCSAARRRPRRGFRPAPGRAGCCAARMSSVSRCMPKTSTSRIRSWTRPAAAAVGADPAAGRRRSRSGRRAVPAGPCRRRAAAAASSAIQRGSRLWR